MNTKEKNYLNFKIPSDLKKYAANKAKESGMSLASFIRFLIVKDRKENK